MDSSAYEVVFIAKATDALHVIEDFFGSARHSPEYLVVVSGTERPAEDLIARLVDGLSAEKVLAAEAVPVEPELFATHQAELTAQTIPRLSSTVIAFKAELLREYLDLAHEALGSKVTCADIGIFLNRLGLSSIGIPLPRTLLPKQAKRKISAQPARDWDGYIQNTEQYFQRHPQNFYVDFAEQLDAHGSHRVLIDASRLPPVINGTSRLAVGFLHFLNEELRQGDLAWEVYVLAPAESLNLQALGLTELKAFDAASDWALRFDIGVSITPVTDLQRCSQIVRMCLRWVVLHLDIIALRAIPHLSQQPSAQYAFEFAWQHADPIVSISKFSQLDAESYLPTPTSSRTEVCLLGVPDEFLSAGTAEYSEFADAVFVLGNDEPHKQTQSAVRELLNSGERVVSISRNAALSENHTVFSPTELDDSKLKSLISSVAVVVFASMYEGFGLPVVETAATEKPIVIWDTAVNHEVTEQLGLDDVVFCSSRRDLPELVLRAKTITPKPSHNARKMSDFYRDFVGIITASLNAEINLERTVQRWDLARMIQASLEEQSDAFQKKLLAHDALAHTQTRPHPLRKLKRRITRLINPILRR